VEFITICEEHNYIKPSVYQGLYNLLSRGSEQLFPLFRQHGIAFQAYRFVVHIVLHTLDLTKSLFACSPLAGGFLTGRMTRGDISGTRFAPGNTAFQGYSSMYDKPEMHAAITDLQDTIEPLRISGSQACLRWIYYHSMLGEGDGVILGASTISQIVQNVDNVSKGPLPDEVVEKIDSLWEKLC
jgi:aflatoxin B1 aldehyde reductase